ncbi:hypothetical protein JMJ77_0014643, partial [Colletotrichum scovillei]
IDGLRYLTLVLALVEVKTAKRGRHPGTVLCV